MRKLLIAALLLAPAISSCAAVLAVPAGALIGQEVIDNNVYVGQLRSSGPKTWAQTKVTLSNLSLKPIEVDNEAMKATADVDGATVTVFVSTYDYNQAEIKVSAKKYLANNGQIAKMVFDKIIADLGDQR